MPRHLTNSTRKPTDFTDIEKSSVSVRQFKKQKKLAHDTKNNIDFPPPPPPKKKKLLHCAYKYDFSWTA